MSRSFALSMWVPVIGSAGGTFILSTISRASALTSHGWPAESSKARASASSAKGWPVSAVCCA